MRPNGITVPFTPHLKTILLGLSILVGGCAEIIQNYEPRTPATSNEEPADSLIDGNASTSGSGYNIEEYYPTPDEFVAVEAEPTVIRVIDPVYPARAEGREATVWIRALVDKEGKVKEARIAKSSGSNLGFDEAALEAARQYEYKPATQNGKPIALWVTYPVEFKAK